METTPSQSLSNQSVLDATEQSRLLEEAKEHAIGGEREKAFEIVTRVLDSNENNPDALWLYANLTPDRDSVIPTLKELLALQPDHQKAQAMLKTLETKLVPENEVKVPQRASDQYLEARPSSPAQDSQTQLLQQMILQQQKMIEHQLKQSSNQASVNITNVNTNTATATAVASMPFARRNEQAYSTGKFCATFLCTFGVAHLMNGKPVMGIVTMLLGWTLWLPILVAGIATVIGAFIVIPLHLSFARQNAESGARID